MTVKNSFSEMVVLPKGLFEKLWKFMGSTEKKSVLERNKAGETSAHAENPYLRQIQKIGPKQDFDIYNSNFVPVESSGSAMEIDPEEEEEPLHQLHSNSAQTEFLGKNDAGTQFSHLESGINIGNQTEFPRKKYQNVAAQTGGNIGTQTQYPRMKYRNEEAQTELNTSTSVQTDPSINFSRGIMTNTFNERPIPSAHKAIQFSPPQTNRTVQSVSRGQDFGVQTSDEFSGGKRSVRVQTRADLGHDRRTFEEGESVLVGRKRRSVGVKAELGKKIKPAQKITKVEAQEGGRKQSHKFTSKNETVTQPDNVRRLSPKFECDICGKGFARPFTLKRHKETLHGSIYKKTSFPSWVKSV